MPKSKENLSLVREAEDPTLKIQLAQQRSSHSGWSMLLSGSNGWLWEIVSIAFSLVTFAAILILLGFLDGKSVPSLPFDVTVNAIVSVLSTASKASMILAVSSGIGQLGWVSFRTRRKPHKLLDLQHFDAASRGPLGSLKLMAMVRTGVLAYLGAFVVIGSTAFEPFIQQLVSYPNRVAYSTSARVTAQRAQHYQNPDLTLTSTVSAQVGQGMINAIARGIFDGDFYRQLQPTCPSGNCTWSPFPSIAMCSQCINVTTDAKENFKCSRDPSKQFDDDVSPWYDCSLRFGDGASTKISEYNSEWPMFSSWEIGNETTYARTAFGKMQSPFFALGLARMFGERTDGGPQLVEGLACSFSYCINTYNLSMTETELNQTTDSTWYPPDVGGAEGFGYNMTWTVPLPASVVSQFSNIFTVRYDALRDLQNTLRAEFIGNVSWYGSVQRTSSNILYALNATSDQPAMFETIASSITDYIRLVAPNVTTDEASTSVEGLLGTVEVYMHVRWLWAILPGIVLVVATLFVPCVMHLTIRKRMQPWKSSLLAVLFHGLENDASMAMLPQTHHNLDGQTEEPRGQRSRQPWQRTSAPRGPRGGSLNTNREMEAEAKSTRVRLGTVEDDDRLHLRRIHRVDI